MKIRELLKNYRNHEYATKDGRHLAASLFLCALEAILYTGMTLALVLLFVKVIEGMMA